MKTIGDTPQFEDDQRITTEPNGKTFNEELCEWSAARRCIHCKSFQPSEPEIGLTGDTCIVLSRRFSGNNRFPEDNPKTFSCASFERKR